MIPSTVLASRISRTSLSLDIADTCRPWPGWGRLSLPGYYGGSVTLALAGCRRSHISAWLDVLARRRCLVRPLKWARCSPPPQRKIWTATTLPSYLRGPAIDAVIGECTLASLETEVQAIRLSPYRAGLARRCSNAGWSSRAGR